MDLMWVKFKFKVRIWVNINYLVNDIARVST